MESARKPIGFASAGVVLVMLVAVAGGTAAGAERGRGEARPTLGEFVPEPDADGVILNERAIAAGALGLYYDDETNETVVLLSSSGVDFDLVDVGDLSLDIRIEYSPLTRSYIESAKDDLRRLVAQLGANDSYFFSFHPRDQRIHVTTTTPTYVFDDVAVAYPQLIDVNIGAGGRQSRHSDYPPFWGGAEVSESLSGFQCSTGFAVREDEVGATTRYMVTAGHCYELGQSVYSPGSDKYLGSVVIRKPFPEKDMELIGGKTYEGKVYTSSSSTGTGSDWVYSAANPAIGPYTYCRSGAVTFVKCKLQIISFEGELCGGIEGCTQNLIEYRSLNSEDSDFGDSGSPFYLPGPESNTVRIRGLHLGGYHDQAMFAHTYAQIKSMNVTIASDYWP